ncbi:MAG: PepSY-associated TM helix domain-containing protein [Bacteroidota bacterium]
MAKKTRKNYVKKIFGWLHLWLGLLSGAVVLVSMLGATVFVWEEELTNWYYHDLVYADKVGSTILPPSTLYAAVQEAYPDKEFRSLRAKAAPTKNYTLRSYKRAENPGWTWASGVEHYYVVYINPYTAQVVGHIDKKRDWIMLSRFLHQNLLLNRKVGEEIVGAAALIMIFLALSGIYLWWPKNKKVLKHRLKIKWDASFKRVNWDIHSVGGFYTWLFLLFFAGTGLTWSYSWWKDGIYRILGNEPEEVFVRPEPPAITNPDYTQAMDIAFQDAVNRQPNWHKIYFSIPSATQEKGTISAGIYYDNGDSWWETSDYYYYHPETAAVHHSMTHDKKLTGEKWRNSNYAMHVGSIYGLPTKLIATFCALFFGSLPVSGLLIWVGRRKKKKKRVPRRKKVIGDTEKIQVKVLKSNKSVI